MTLQTIRNEILALSAELSTVASNDVTALERLADVNVHLQRSAELLACVIADIPEDTQ